MLQRCGQAVGGQIDLDKVVHNAQTHAAFDIVELLIARQHDEGRQGGAVLMAGFRKRKAVHDRHTDVGNHDVRLLLLNGPERLGTVAGGARRPHSPARPSSACPAYRSGPAAHRLQARLRSQENPLYFWLSGPADGLLPLCRCRAHSQCSGRRPRQSCIAAACGHSTCPHGGIWRRLPRGRAPAGPLRLGLRRHADAVVR